MSQGQLTISNERLAMNYPSAMSNVATNRTSHIANSLKIANRTSVITSLKGCV
jgi:hypothetical protein